MCWFKRVFLQSEPAPPINADVIDLDDEKQRRISTLSGEEQQAFSWFAQGYTARWTAETMLLDRKVAKQLFNALFRKLGVANEAELCRLYRTAPLLPKDAPEKDHP